MALPALTNRNTLLTAAVILAAAIVLGGYLLGDGVRRARMADRAVTVRGLAERDVTADLATWTLNLSAQGTELPQVLSEMEQDTRAVQNFLRTRGFRAQDLTDAGVSVSSFYDSNRGENTVTVRRRIQLRTNDVMRARAAHGQQFELVRAGVALEDGSDMVYSFTRLNDIKPEMIAAATQDARRGAERFAQNSGAGVGGIRSATQGYFSIGARAGNETSEGTGSDSPFQKVRVVTTIEFYLD